MICSGDRRTFTVCKIAPIIGTAKNASRNRWVSQSITPTVSPGRTPNSLSPLAKRPMRSQHAIGEALLIAVDDFLISRMQHGRVKKVFDQEGILICGGGHVDESARHGFIPLYSSFGHIGGE